MTCQRQETSSRVFQLLQFWILDSQLLGQIVCQIIAVMKTKTGVFVVFKTERESKCPNELFL